jgi:hypothetical protein
MSNVNTPERSTYKRQTEIAIEALKVNPDLRNKELNEKIREGLFKLGLGAPAFVSNSVLTRARNQLGIKSVRGRRPGTKNKATLERKAAAEAAMKAIEAETTRSLNAALAGIPSRPTTPGVFSASTTGIFTGNERINVFHGPVAPTLAELLRPVEKLMRDRGISSITLDVDGLHVTRTITESVVL